jgi:hypothetical protein
MTGVGSQALALELEGCQLLNKHAHALVENSDGVD